MGSEHKTGWRQTRTHIGRDKNKATKERLNLNT